MIRFSTCCLAVSAAVLGVSTVVAARGREPEAAPVYGVKLPAGYRDWKLISVAHEAGRNNDIRAILGNDIAVQAYRKGIRPFPDGAVIWSCRCTCGWAALHEPKRRSPSSACRQIPDFGWRSDPGRQALGQPRLCDVEP